MINKRTGILLAVLAVVASVYVYKFGIPTQNATNQITGPTLQPESSDVPEGFVQLLPRGGIPAIDDPVYVSKDEAKISADSFVLGILVEGQPLAYSLNLLNRHEIVNDTVGDTNFAAVW